MSGEPRRSSRNTWQQQQALRRLDVPPSTFSNWTANISHYYVKGDTVRVNDVDGFINVIKSLHAKYDNAEEVANAIDVRLVGPLASVRVPFGFVMGPNTLEGEDIFNLAFCGRVEDHP